MQKKCACVSKECVACGCCVKVCPVGAMAVYRGLYAKPDEEKCVGCGKCAEACPASVITVILREGTPE